ncbi:SMP-30/gluconolactonase/LRE family protein [Flavicella sediminum]|uniref:SMP-30/gluconolactonase/LRE family protein n=1 Tax=Flavicella sediminum TaxID=2585141 RepID=UPI00112356E2|nr:SMP-30/gluconolactonase/LRE family protein [Flavicella sediminum]
MKKIISIKLYLLCILLLSFCKSNIKKNLPITKGKIQLAATGFKFTEGPAVNAKGQVYFTDQPNDKIHIWDSQKGVSLFLEGTKRSNGMYFNKKQQLLACADEDNQLIYFDKNKNIQVLHENFEDKHLNAPNDLWIAPNGGIYFTDPYYPRKWWAKNHKEIQETQGVYFVSTNGAITRVINDFKKPNGIIGTPDGKTLYVADIQDKKIWKYTIGIEGQLTNKTFFAPHGSDGMTLDHLGNIYLTSGKIWVYNPNGKLIQEIETPEKPSNVCFGGKHKNILFITARTSIYTLKMNVHGVN